MKARTLLPLTLIPAALLLGASFLSGKHNSQPRQGTPIATAATQAAPSVLLKTASSTRPVASPAETYVELDLSQGKGTFNEWLIVPSGDPAILSDNQIKTVGELKPGDRVRVSDSLTGRVTTARPHRPSPQPASSVKTPPGTVASRVIGKTERSTDTLLYLTTRDEVVKTTPEHPFSVAGKGWVPAGQLKPGDALETEDGTTVPVVSTEQRHEPTTVYNLRIVGTENFFVGKGRLLVHNGGPCVPTLSEAKDLMRGWAADPETGRIADSIRYHFGEHGEEVGAENVWQYLRKADNFGSLKGRGIPIEGRTDGVLHYFKGDRYIDVAPGGGIISYGAR